MNWGEGWGLSIAGKISGTKHDEGHFLYDHSQVYLIFYRPSCIFIVANISYACTRMAIKTVTD